MNSVTTSSAISELTRVLLDANIIAKPVTRTLLVVGGVPSGFRAFWSRAAEREAQVHAPEGIAAVECPGAIRRLARADRHGCGTLRRREGRGSADPCRCCGRGRALPVSDLFVERQINPPSTPAQFHAAIAKNHPRLFAAHADLYEVEPEQRIHREPEVIFRGARCLRCEQIIADPAAIIDGLGPECR